MSKAKSQRRVDAVAALASLIAAGLAACGGSAQSPAGPGATDSSAPTVILSQTLTEVEAGGQRFVNLTLPRDGALTVTVRWSDPANAVTASLSSVDCFGLGNFGATCRVRESVRQGKESPQGSIDVADADGGYLLVLRNLGPGTESIQVTGELRWFTSAPPAPPTPVPTPPPNRPNPRRSWEP